MAVTLVKLADERLGETEVVKTPEGIDAVYSSRARSLVDAVYDWSRFNSLPQGYQWIRTELARDPGIAAEIVRVALRYANVSTLMSYEDLLDNYPTLKPEHIQAAMLYAAAVLTMDEAIYP
ncbi:MAG: DUF433 domain-containing protein [Thermoguttaceae bacterium]